MTPAVLALELSAPAVEPLPSWNDGSARQALLEHEQAGDGARPSRIVLHHDATRESAYGPAQGLPDTKVGAFPGRCTTR
jgi:hypothetical protein